MKKIIYVFILIFSLVITMTSCFDKDKGKSDPDLGNDDKKELEIIEALLEKEYENVELIVTTKTDGAELKAVYTITKDSVEYYVENLALIPTDGDFSAISENGLVVLQGTATVENGIITGIDGDSVTLPSYTTLVGAFEIDGANLKNVSIGNGVLEADVTVLSDLLNVSVSANQAHLKIEYGQTSVKKLTITYKTDLSDVTTVYEFGQ